MSDTVDFEKDAMREFSERVTAPIVYAFVDWVISEARVRGVKRLWFLARDGYLPYLLAKEICSSRKIEMECRYFYCSRNSLRTSSYHLVDDSEIASYVLTRGYRTSADTVFARLNLSPQKRAEMLSRTRIESPEDVLSKRDFSELCRLVSNDREIFPELRKSSEQKYQSMREYILQSGMAEENRVAIVDSGWTGSMQRSLRILLSSLGYSGELLGFYFGMYKSGRHEDGEYLTYYFGARSGLLRRVFFNNNVFECMLSAPHPMTVGYAVRNGIAVPVFADDHDAKMLGLITVQINTVLDYYRSKNSKTKRKTSAEKDFYRISRLIKRAMIYPSKAEVRLLSHFMFCDDFTEKYKEPLADEAMLHRLKNNLLLPRALRRIFHSGDSGSELFWSYGTLAFLPWYKRPWYRFNLLLWDFLKAVRERFFSRSLGGD